MKYSPIFTLLLIEVFRLTRGNVALVFNESNATQFTNSTEGPSHSPTSPPSPPKPPAPPTPPLPPATPTPEPVAPIYTKSLVVEGLGAQLQLFVSKGSEYLRLGQSVASFGSNLLVGAAQERISPKSFVFGVSVETVGKNLSVTWTADTTLSTGLSSDVPYDGFGRSVAMDGSCMLVGAPFSRAGSSLDAGGSKVQPGAVYVVSYRKTPLGHVLPQKASPQILFPFSPYASESMHFGASVDLKGNTLVVGAPGATVEGHGPQSGAVFSFAWNVTSM
jgi:hypothetical protein